MLDFSVSPVSELMASTVDKLMTVFPSSLVYFSRLHRQQLSPRRPASDYTIFTARKEKKRRKKKDASQVPSVQLRLGIK